MSSGCWWWATEYWGDSGLASPTSSRSPCCRSGSLIGAGSSRVSRLAGSVSVSVITSPVAQKLIDNNPEEPTRAFLPLGIAYLVLSLIGAAFFRNPPEGVRRAWI